jgi:hypothetical protein
MKKSLGTFVDGVGTFVTGGTFEVVFARGLQYDKKMV